MEGVCLKYEALQKLYAVAMKKNYYFKSLGAPYLERPVWITVQVTFSQWTHEVLEELSMAIYTDSGGTGLGLKYSLIVGAIVSDYIR